jgi:hypothetical protein
MDVSLHMLPPLGETINLSGEPVRGAGWYGQTSGLHSVMIRVSNFQGRIKVEASVAIEPTADDWYSVLPDQAEYWEYPHPDYVIPPNNRGETSTLGFNFTNNAVWLRASVWRDYLVPGNVASMEATLRLLQMGTVHYVLVNY